MNESNYGFNSSCPQAYKATLPRKPVNKEDVSQNTPFNSDNLSNGKICLFIHASKILNKYRTPVNLPD